jgi:hypothetical protein
VKTVKVKIALEIGPEGNWQAYGFPSADHDECLNAFESIENSARYWIEAEVPVPDAEPAVIVGKAVEVGGEGRVADIDLDDANLMALLSKPRPA